MKTNLLLIRNGLLVAIFFLSFAFTANAQKSNCGKIEITNFHIVKEQNKIAIRWATSDTSMTNYFEVERSSDGKTFKTVAYVLGADPAKSDCECFSCFDKIDARTKESFYRLKHVNTNGSVQFSEIKILALK
jgi:hypothetical protein